MLRMERLERIVQLTEENEVVTIKDLIKEIGTSPATTRRDIDLLASEGRLIKTRGGAASAKRYASVEPPYKVKSVLNIEEKMRIASRAVEIIEDGDHISIDSGSTCLEFAKKLNSTMNLQVVTNDLLVALEITRNINTNLIMAGGLMRKGYYASYGHFCTDILKVIQVQKAFIATDAVDCQRGLMSYIPDDIEIKKMMIDMGAEVILLCDHSKFETPAYINICPLSKINMIITGKELNKAALHCLREQKINVELV